MVGLHKDPTGENIFSKSTLSGSSLPANLTSKSKDQQQIATLKMKIEKLEAKLEAYEAKVFFWSAGHTANYFFNILLGHLWVTKPKNKRK